MAEYVTIPEPPVDPTATALAAVLAALTDLPNPRELSGMWRRADWEQGRTDAVEAVTAVLAAHERSVR